jgi:hypothetical protein
MAVTLGISTFCLIVTLPWVTLPRGTTSIAVVTETLLMGQT